jgi:carbon-monoxide dehydrogenase medium subunit
MKSAKFRYERPTSLDAALRMLADNGGARAIAGGQSLGPMLNLRLAEPDLIVDISRLPELTRIDNNPDAIVIGAAVRHAEFEDGRVPDVLEGLLGRVARGIAYRAIRNRGTLGGSLAHADPAADWPTIMIALGATIQVRSIGGERLIPASELITGPLMTSIAPDELIETIRIPRFDRFARGSYHKISVKPGDFAEAFAAIVKDPARSQTRVILSGNGLSPITMTATGEALTADNDPAEIKQAIRSDLKASGLEDLLYEATLYQTSLVRAATEFARA